MTEIMSLEKRIAAVGDGIDTPKGIKDKEYINKVLDEITWSKATNLIKINDDKSDETLTLDVIIEDVFGDELEKDVVDIIHRCSYGEYLYLFGRALILEAEDESKGQTQFSRITTELWALLMSFVYSRNNKNHLTKLMKLNYGTLCDVVKERAYKAIPVKLDRLNKADLNRSKCRNMSVEDVIKDICKKTNPESNKDFAVKSFNYNNYEAYSEVKTNLFLLLYEGCGVSIPLSLSKLISHLSERKEDFSNVYIGTEDAPI